jgi:hypothetical protein
LLQDEVDHVPVAVQVFCCEVLAHSVWLGAHTPWHEAVPPADTRHVWLLQVAGVPHAPVALQVETPLLWHSVVPGVHVPWQDAVDPDCTHAELVQGTAVPQVPPLQLCKELPEHCEVPGEQVPVHTPLTHVDAEHGVAGPQAPLALQVSTPLPLPPSAVVEHRMAPGVQFPMHEPPTHAWLVQATVVVLHVPVELHVE